MLKPRHLVHAPQPGGGARRRAAAPPPGSAGRPRRAPPAASQNKNSTAGAEGAQFLTTRDIDSAPNSPGLVQSAERGPQGSIIRPFLRHMFHLVLVEVLLPTAATRSSIISNGEALHPIRGKTSPRKLFFVVDRCSWTLRPWNRSLAGAASSRERHRGHVADFAIGRRIDVYREQQQLRGHGQERRLRPVANTCHFLLVFPPISGCPVYGCSNIYNTPGYDGGSGRKIMRALHAQYFGRK